MRRSKALIVAAEEDFGISMVEAQACGIPVIAYGRGGSLEIIRGMEHKTPTGVHFHKQEIGEIQRAVRTFQDSQGLFNKNYIRANAERFSESIFQKQILKSVALEWTKIQFGNNRLLGSFIFI